MEILICFFQNNSINPSTNILDRKEGLRKKDDLGGDLLYRNDDGFFDDATNISGIYTSSIGFGLGVSISDINNDEWLIFTLQMIFLRRTIYI